MNQKKHDLWLIGILVLLSLSIALFLFTTKKEGGYVKVEIDGQEYARYPLDSDITVTLQNGERYNILQIRDGTASVTEANCPDRLCCSQGPIQYSGQTVVCLPNKTVITVYAADSREENVLWASYEN